MRLPIPPSGRREPTYNFKSCDYPLSKTNPSADEPPAPAHRTPRGRRRSKRAATAQPRRCDAILRELTDAGVPLPPTELAARLAIGRTRRAPRSTPRIATLERDGEVLVNRKGELCIVAKLDLVTGKVQGHPDGFGFLVPDAGGDDLFLVAARDAQGAARRSRRGQARPASTAAAGREGEIVEVLERANREVVGRAARGARRVVRRRGEPAHQPGHADPAGRSAASARPARWWWSRSSSSPSAHREAIARVKEVLGSATDPGMEIEIALRKHELPFEFERRGEARRRSALARGGAPGRPQGPQGPHAPAARDDRRRDREGLRRRRVLRARRAAASA